MDEDEAPSTSRSSPRPRKHARETTSNGIPVDHLNCEPTAKRSRRSNGIEATTSTNGNGDCMELDSSIEQSGCVPIPIPANDSPAQAAGEAGGMEVEVLRGNDEANLTLTLTNGSSVGVQSDKVAELGPETTLLSVPDRNVMHTAWNPRDPAILVTGGDALCRIWNWNFKISPNSDCPQHVDLLDPEDLSLVTTLAWSPDGDILAVATRSHATDYVGAVTLRTKAGELRDDLPAAPDMLLVLRWSPSGSHLLGITSSGGERSALAVWNTGTGISLQSYDLENIITDAAWSDDRNFTICGHGIIADFEIDGQAITNLQTRNELTDAIDQKWTHICYDSTTNTTAIAAEELAVLAIIDSSGTFSITTAHDAQITALAYQPISSPSSHTALSPRLLATSSLDGNIRIWDVKNPFTTVHVLSLGRSTPAMAMSFTPDGYLVAAAHWNRVLIWNAEAGGVPRASWRGELGKWDGTTNGMDQDSGTGEEESPTHSLSWDADGGKLAYGLGSQVRNEAKRELYGDRERRTNRTKRLP